MRKAPTDLQILEAIYDRYYDEFAISDRLFPQLAYAKRDDPLLMLSGVYAAYDDAMLGARDEHSIIGPPPCATCRYAKRRAVTGEACTAFYLYCRHGYEKYWRLMPKQPRADIGTRMGFTARPLPEVRTVCPWNASARPA